MIRRLWVRHVVCRRRGHVYAYPYMRGYLTQRLIRLRPTCLRCEAFKPGTDQRGYPDQ